MGLLTFRLCLVLLMVVYVGVTQAKEDPELRQCKHQCRHQRQFDESQKLGCERSCEEYIEEKERIRKWREEQEEQEIREGNEQGRHETDDNPYVFQYEHFRTHFSTQQGRVRVLPKFTKRSQLLKGIENFRVLLFEANPNTFILPNHWDADAIFFVAQGRGTVSLVFTDRRESFNIEEGHVMVIPAGVTAYLINGDNNDKLLLAKLINPVSNPAKFVPFFGTGGRNPESLFNAFSPEVLEASFKTSSARLERIFSQQRGGVIIRASKEQIRALTHKEGTRRVFESKSSKDFSPVQLLSQRPKSSNEFGKLFEIDASDNKVLQDLGIGVSFANISQGSMSTPFYNSRATKVAIVLNGGGQFEMACPHVSKSDRHHYNPHHDIGRSQRGKESESPIHYKKISSELRPGTVFVVPPGHPFVTIASENNNLEIICFEINAENNQKFPLAGQKNILRNIEREAKELAFANSADEVDSVFENQDEEFFFRGPRQWRQRGVAVI